MRIAPDFDAVVRLEDRQAPLRAQGAGVFFTVDAGPQVKAICLPEAAARVAGARGGLPGVTRVPRCALGEGARVVGA